MVRFFCKTRRSFDTGGCGERNLGLIQLRGFVCRTHERTRVRRRSNPRETPRPPWHAWVSVPSRKKKSSYALFPRPSPIPRPYRRVRDVDPADDYRRCPRRRRRAVCVFSGERLRRRRRRRRSYIIRRACAHVTAAGARVLPAISRTTAHSLTSESPRVFRAYARELSRTPSPPRSD